MRLSYPLGLQPHQGISAASRQTPLPPSLRSAPSPEEKVDKTAANKPSLRHSPRTTSRLEQSRVLPSPPPRQQRGGWCRAANAARSLFDGTTSLNSTANAFAIESEARSESHGACRPLRLEQPPASNYPRLELSRVLPLCLPRRQRGGWCRAANEARSLFDGTTSLNSTANAFAIESEARSESHGACRPLRLEQPPASNYPRLELSRVLPLCLPRRQRGGWCRAANEARSLFDGTTSLNSTANAFAIESEARSESHGACRPLRLEQLAPRCPFYSRPLKHPMTFFANCVCTKRITRSPGSSTDSPFGMTAAPSRT